MKRSALIALALLIVAALVGGGLILPGLRSRARVGAGFVAKQMCSCLNVAERAFDACRADLAPSMTLVRAGARDPARGTHRGATARGADRRLPR